LIFRSLVFWTGLTKRDNYAKKGMDDKALDRMEKSMAKNFAGEDIVSSHATDP
jgi:hypothetical protein